MNRTRNLLLGAIVGSALEVVALRWSAGPASALAAGAVVAALGIGVVTWSLRAGRHVPLAEAIAATQDCGGYVLWKPGCIYCERLLARLGGDPRIHWVNVWRDPSANAAVRAHNRGDELTPTAVVGEVVLRNPSVAELRAALDRRP